jgi:penicillin-binding protein 2
MSDVANGPGSASHARLPFPDIKLAGKTGTAQVVGLNIGNGKGGLWKHRDHGHFICFAPVENPRYACSVVIEHGGGSPSAYPIARDILTYIFDKQKGMDILTELEKGWGGTPKERLDARYRKYAAEYGVGAPAVSPEQESQAAEQADSNTEPAQPIVRDAQSPAPEPAAAANPATPPATAPSPTPSSSPTAGPAQTPGNPQ